MRDANRRHRHTLSPPVNRLCRGFEFLEKYIHGNFITGNLVYINGEKFTKMGATAHPAPRPTPEPFPNP